MHRLPILQAIRRYQTPFEEEKLMQEQMLQFVEQHKDCFERTNLKGHLTASAWILNQNHDKVLLVHHRKLDKWLQPGGHADGEVDLQKVALKEVSEETGLTNIKFLRNDIFDLDVHTIPQYKEVPAHEHYDIRFVFEASDSDTLTINHESKQLQWFSLSDVQNVNSERSLMRMVEKIQHEFFGAHISFRQ